MLDYRAGLFGFYIVILSNYFQDMLSCDLQRFMKKYIIPRHIIAIMTAFFAIVITGYGTEEGEILSVFDYLKLTMYVYIIFLFSSKAKGEFIFPMLVLLLIDQIISLHVSYLKKISEKDKSDKTYSINIFTKIRSVLSVFILAIIFIGMIAYFIRQYYYFGNEFSIVKFILGTFTCNINSNK